MTSLLSKSTNRVSRTKLFLTLVVGFLSGFVVVLYLNRQHIFHPNIEIDRFKNPVYGIDVSAHNGEIDYPLVVADGHSFVFIKASEGITFRDSLFAGNFKRARAVGLRVGAYHFFRKSRDGKAQARNFLNAVGGARLDLPLVVDVEDWGNDKDVPDSLTAIRLKDLITTLTRAGKRVMIYTNGDGYKSYYLAGGFDDIPLWLCAFKKPDEISDIPHVFQQYSHWGTVPGVKGNVDLNIFNGTREQWNNFLSGDVNPD